MFMSQRTKHKVKHILMNFDLCQQHPNNAAAGYGHLKRTLSKGLALQ